jgi:hypothetical protein
MNPVTINFVLHQARMLPVAERIEIYRALASDLSGDEKSEILAEAEALEKAESRCTEFAFRFAQKFSPSGR